MKTIRFKIEGVSPLMMHDDKTANPLHPASKAMKEISGKRKKTDEDHYNMAKIEFLAGIYYRNPNGNANGYYIKAECFEGTFVNAAKAFKLGKVFKESVSIPNDPVFKFKDYRKTPEELFQIDDYRDLRPAKVGQSKVMRCRPIFNSWECETEIWYDEERLNEEQISQIVQYAAKYIGVCDYRPKYGRFNATIISNEN